MRNSWGNKVPVWKPVYSPERAQPLGVSRQGMAQSIQIGTTGMTLGEYRQGDQVLPILLKDNTVEKIASALGVTTDGLKEYNEETVLYNTNNFYENCGVKNAIGNNQTFNNFPIEQTIELFEKLLEKQKEQFESLKKEK